ncbi:MAG: hypothetical protein Q8930_11270, partial [Bacillota bacterium]|nr:hypothetical protein [Bacillota bacterium]
TGMVCGAIDMVSQAVVIEDFDNSADFISDRDYFDIEASAEVNAAVSLFRLLRKRSPHLHPHPYGEKITKH